MVAVWGLKERDGDGKHKETNMTSLAPVDRGNNRGKDLPAKHIFLLCCQVAA